MGQVNVTKRGKVYQYKFEIAPQKGKRKFISKSGFKTRLEAIEAGSLAHAEYLNAGVPFEECKISYSDYLDYWIENYCKMNLKYNTINTYQTLIEKYIKPELGLYRLSTITSVRLNLFITKLCDEHDFSKSYFKNILKVVKGSFRDACDLYGFLKYNPALTLRLPKLETKKSDVKHLYTGEEIQQILYRFQKNDIFTCSFLTSCFTGMRTGEVFALTWDNIDLENGIIHIKHSVYDKPKDDKGRWYLGTTKTDSGERDIFISPTLLTALKNFKKKQDLFKELFGDEYTYYHAEYIKNNAGKIIEIRIVKNEKDIVYNNELNLVFTKINGVYSGTDAIRYPFKIIHEEMGIDKCRFYDLRGSYATKILNNGIAIREVADILGHKNVETTENYYISSTEASRKYATEFYDKMLKNNIDIIDKIIEYKV